MDKNNISFKDILERHIFNAIDEIKDNNISFNITQFKSIVNSSINQKLKGLDEDLSYEVKSKFSGRGRAWAKIKVDESCNTWLNLERHLSVETTDFNFERYSSLLDLFKHNGFGWVRFSGSNTKTTNFKIRYLGGKNTTGINFKLSNEVAINLEVLEGVPHKLGLEQGLLEEVKLKNKIAENITDEELSNFGIQTLESLLREDA